jgi:hypothetical protein
MATAAKPAVTTAATEANIIYAPDPLPHLHGATVFLAGSIDQGTAIEWQADLSDRLSHLPITILNPRRLDWDATWVQSPSFPPFKQQVDWELDMQESASVIAMYFGKDSQAPISLLELGLFSRTGKMVVCCPEGFWRRGNVQIVCQRFGIKLVDSLEDLAKAVEDKLEDQARSARE